MMNEADTFLALQTRTGWGRVLRRFADWIAPQPGTRALDVGCGPALFPALLAQRGCHAFGLDADPAMLTGRLHPLALVADARALPFPPGTFHLVTASNVIFLLDDPHAALCAMRRVLRPDGQLALLNPSEHLSVAAAQALADERGLTGLARQTLLTWAARAERHHRWDENSLRILLAQAGWHLVESDCIMGPGFARLARAVPADDAPTAPPAARR